MDYKAIPQHSAYKVSECGTSVICIKNNRELKQSEQVNVRGIKSGYLYVTLLYEQDTVNHEHYWNILPKRVAVHRLVSFAWLPERPTDKHIWVNHKNGIRSDNRAINLEWTTISQNIKHSHEVLGRRVAKGTDHWLYGKRQTAETRRKMSLAKRGERHPKFKGWWVVNGVKYTSCKEAATVNNTNAKRIERICKKRQDGCYFLDKARLESMNVQATDN
jgi:hypothetical protein